MTIHNKIFDVIMNVLFTSRASAKFAYVRISVISLNLYSNGQIATVWNEWMIVCRWNSFNSKCTTSSNYTLCYSTIFNYYKIHRSSMTLKWIYVCLCIYVWVLCVFVCVCIDFRNQNFFEKENNPVYSKSTAWIDYVKIKVNF